MWAKIGEIRGMEMRGDVAMSVDGEEKCEIWERGEKLEMNRKLSIQKKHVLACEPSIRICQNTRAMQCMRRLKQLPVGLTFCD
jgi:hypothetical protein|tara:strand:- start:290 stop:538 length:249 start_codon:yes stop_codon:yes gene_type:complete